MNEGNVRNYRRRRIWVNSHFQMKYTALVAGVAAAILALLGIIYGSALADQNRLLGVSQVAKAGSAYADDSATEFDAEQKAMAQEGDSHRLLYLVIIAVGLVGLLGYVGVRVTFRAAGPAYAVSQMLKTMASGNFTSARRLRDGDDFRFLEDDVGALRASLKAAAAGDVELMGRAIELLKILGKPEGTGPSLVDDVGAVLTRNRVSELVADLAVTRDDLVHRYGLGQGAGETR